MPQAILAETLQTVLRVQGMKCAGCVQAVEQALSQERGVLSASVNLVTEKALVYYQTDQIKPDGLAMTLTDLGFPTQVEAPLTSAVAENAEILTPSSISSENPQHLQQIGIAATLVILSVVGHLHQFLPLHIPILGALWFHWGLATLALLGPGRKMIRDGWQSWRHNMPNMNTLVSLGALTAYGASCTAFWVPQLGWDCFFDAPVMIVGLVLLGRILEQQARGRATAAFQSLMNLQPPLARQVLAVTQDSMTSNLVPVDQVQVGTLLQVWSGDKFPVDGVVRLGQSCVDESMLTGESRPVEKSVGNEVMAGTLNQAQTLVIEATRTGRETALAQIVQFVEAAQTRKAPIQRLADRVAGYFVYGVMAIAALTFLFWVTVGSHIWPGVLALTHVDSVHGGSLQDPNAVLLSLKLAIAVLVVACPCALGLATPTAIVVGTSLGAEQGLLIRGGDVLEAVHHLDTVIFDKTGTLTTGLPQVTQFWLSPESPLQSPEQLLQIAASLEACTQHPFALAIQTKAQNLGLGLLEVVDGSSQSGLGMTGMVSDRWVCLGSPTWIAEQCCTGIPEQDVQQAQDLAMQGQSIVMMSMDGYYIGGIAVQDSLRPDALETLQALRHQNLRVLMLTGDQHQTATAIGQALEFAPDEIYAAVLPTEKAAVIQRLQGEGHRVAMVGDGINDAPALAQANVGIALSSGTDVAIETAQIVLMSHLTRSVPQLKDVVKAITLSRATFRTIQQNLFWAFAYNAIGIPAAAGVFLPAFGLLLSPAAAAALMALSSVSVVTNALRLRYQPLD